MRWAIAILTTVFLCTGCHQIFDNAYLQNGPFIEVSSKQVRVGEPLQITLKGSFTLPRTSSVAETKISSFRLSACFAANRLCEGDPPLPSSLTIFEGGDYQKEFGDLTLSRGKTLQISHTFAVASEKAQTLQLAAIYQAKNENGQLITFSQSEPVSVVFR